MSVWVPPASRVECVGMRSPDTPASVLQGSRDQAVRSTLTSVPQTRVRMTPPVTTLWTPTAVCAWTDGKVRYRGLVHSNPTLSHSDVILIFRIRPKGLKGTVSLHLSMWHLHQAYPPWVLGSWDTPLLPPPLFGPGLLTLGLKLDPLFGM